MEREVSAIREITVMAAQDRREPDLRERIAIDRHFAALMHLLGGRIHNLTRVYGLMDMQDDARQVCAIGIHRAIAAYDPFQARFTTFVTWQLRGELQSLRHRVRLDQRDSARNAGIRTVPIDQQSSAGKTHACVIIDADALAKTESGASRLMAARCADALLDEWEDAMRARDADACDRASGQTAAPSLPANRKLASERRIVTRFLNDQPEPVSESGLTTEQKRQVTRRVLRHCAQAVGGRDAGIGRFPTQWLRKAELMASGPAV